MLKIPDSPLYVKVNIIFDIFQSDDRLEYDDDLMQNPATKRTEEEIIEATKEHVAKTKAIVLEMVYIYIIFR